MGNSQRVLISKSILARAGLEGTADLQMRDGAIETRPYIAIRVKDGPKTRSD